MLLGRTHAAWLVFALIGLVLFLVPTARVQQLRIRDHEMIYVVLALSIAGLLLLGAAHLMSRNDGSVRVSSVATRAAKRHWAERWTSVFVLVAGVFAGVWLAGPTIGVRDLVWTLRHPAWLGALVFGGCTVVLLVWDEKRVVLLAAAALWLVGASDGAVGWTGFGHTIVPASTLPHAAAEAFVFKIVYGCPAVCLVVVAWLSGTQEP